MIPPVQPLVNSVSFTDGAVLGALSETKFVVIDYNLGQFILYEIVGEAVNAIDSVSHLYPASPNQHGFGTYNLIPAQFCETAPGVRAVFYVGYHAAAVEADSYAHWTKITLNGSGLLAVTTGGTYGWGWDTKSIRRIVASANGGATTAWELSDGTVLYNAPNGGVVDGIETGLVGSGRLVAYTDGPGPRVFVTASGIGTWPPTVTLTRGAASITFTHPTGSRVHDYFSGDIREESTLQYLPLGDNRVVIIGSTLAGELTYRIFTFDSDTLAWETDWVTVTLPDGYAWDQYPRAATWDGSVLALGHVRDFWG